MNHYTSGLIAGLVATIVLSALMLMKTAMGMLPGLNAIAMLAGLANQYAGLPGTPLVGWVLHFLIGTLLWGLLFAWLGARIPGPSHVVRGIVFSIGAWVLMMIIPMPLAGAGLFGLKIGIAAPIATLVLHIIFGAVLGAVYGALVQRGHSHGHVAATSH